LGKSRPSKREDESKGGSAKSQEEKWGKLDRAAEEKERFRGKGAGASRQIRGKSTIKNWGKTALSGRHGEGGDQENVFQRLMGGEKKRKVLKKNEAE